MAFASTVILRKAHAFLGEIKFFFLRKSEALKMSAPNFSALNSTGISFTFLFFSLGCEISGEASAPSSYLPQGLELLLIFF